MTPLQLLGRQHWIRRGIRERVLRRTAPFRHQPFEVPFFGLTYTGSLDNYIDWNVYYYGAYEPAILALMQRLLGPESVFVDVGANTGQHTIFAARLAAEIHAFEPLESARATLKRRLILNGITNVHVHECGLGDVAGSMPFFAPVGVNQGMGTFVQYEGNTPTATLPVRRGDDFALSRLDLVKIDVEGNERAVLAGFSETIARLRPAVLFERYRDSTEAELRTLFPADYVLLGVHAREVRLAVFEAQGPFLRAGVAAEMLAIPRERTL